MLTKYFKVDVTVVEYSVSSATLAPVRTFSYVVPVTVNYCSILSITFPYFRGILLCQVVDITALSVSLFLSA